MRAWLAVVVVAGCGRIGFDDAIRDAAVDPSLVGHWTFDEGTGTVAHDTSGHALDGTLTGSVTWNTGILGGAADLEGGLVVVPTGMQLQFGAAGPYTLSAWVLDDTAATVLGSSNWHRIITWADDSGHARALGLGVDASGADRELFVGNVQGTDERHAASATPIASGWHLVTGTFDGATLGLYVDGVRDDGGALDSGIDPQTDTDMLYLGGKGDGSRMVMGLLDDVRIYDRVLAADEIAELFAR